MDFRPGSAKDGISDSNGRAGPCSAELPGAYAAIYRHPLAAPGFLRSMVFDTRQDGLPLRRVVMKPGNTSSEERFALFYRDLNNLASKAKGER